MLKTPKFFQNTPKTMQLLRVIVVENIINLKLHEKKQNMMSFPFFGVFFYSFLHPKKPLTNVL